MVTDEGRPISYMALQVGTPVVTSSGTQFATVEHVLQVPELDVFDGIVITTHHHGVRFVDRDQIADITTAAVRCTFGDDQIDGLPAPRGSLVLHPDTARDEGHSLTSWWGRAFGREHWKELE